MPSCVIVTSWCCASYFPARFLFPTSCEYFQIDHPAHGVFTAQRRGAFVPEANLRGSKGTVREGLRACMASRKPSIDQLQNNRGGLIGQFPRPSSYPRLASRGIVAPFDFNRKRVSCTPSTSPKSSFHIAYLNAAPRASTLDWCPQAR